MNINKVTIITITYNSSKYVRQAIESVLAQSYTNFEYLISDDCSSDNTWEIIQEYRDPRIKAWKNSSNLGEYPNRNFTLSKAKGEYIIWIDGDDILYPHGLEFMVKMLDAFPDSAMACARPAWDNMIYPYELSPKEAMRFELLGSPVLVNGFPDTLFRTKILKDKNGFPTNVISGDTHSKRLIACNNNILLISQQVSWWRKTPGQASSKLETLSGIINTFKSSLAIINNNSFPLDQEEKDLAILILKESLVKVLMRKLLFKGNLISFTKMILNEKITIKTIINSVKPRTYFYKSGSGVDPLALHFSKNPYSNNGIK